MNRSINKILFIVALFLFSRADGQPVKHVIIISIDGFRPDFYRELSWGAVNMQQIAAHGVSADAVNPVFPSLTFPNHTTIITGARPAHHGIVFNAPFDASEENESDEWYWYTRDIQSKTLWQAARDKGLVTVSVNWPVSVGAPVDYLIPIYKGKGQTQLAITGANSVPSGILDTVQLYATGRFDNIDFNTNADFLVMDENVARITGYLFRRYKPGLTTMRLSCTDHFEHIEGRNGELVTRAVAGADRAIRTVIESVERAGLRDSTTIIITGDHGFMDVHAIITPNAWMVDGGLIKDLKTGDWKARWNTAGGSAFLYLKDPDDKATLNEVIRLVKASAEYKQGLIILFDKKKLDSLKADPKAMLAIGTVSGYRFHNSLKPQTRVPDSKGTHGYYQDVKGIATGFVAYGPGLKKGIRIPVMGLEDVAPIVSYLLGLDLQAPDGHVPAGLLDK